MHAYVPVGLGWREQFYCRGLKKSPEKGISPRVMKPGSETERFLCREPSASEWIIRNNNRKTDGFLICA